MIPRAIFFDLGMVLVTFDWNIAVARFAAASKRPAAEIRGWIDNPLHLEFERNGVTGQDFFQRGAASIGFEGTMEEFQRCWNEIFDEIPSSVQQLRRLAGRFPLYAISNTNPWHAAYLEKKFEWFNLFQQRIYSCACGFRKPEPQIYRLALQKARVSAPDSLLIDDRPENIRGAQRIGMRTLYVPTPEILETGLATFVRDSVNL
jgi:glucose-1-phosphatase